MAKKILSVKQPSSMLDLYYEDEEFEKELDKITNDQFANADNARSIKNITQTLMSALRKKYGFSNGELKELTSAILKIHGLDVSNFDTMKMFQTFISENLNDVSIDDNSNKNEKTIKGILNEVKNSTDKLIGYDMLYRVLKELYGQEEAKRLTGDLYDYSLGLADSSSILLNYCWAMDGSRLVLEGRQFGQLPSAPPKRLSSYIAMLCETVHQLSSHLAGAVAVGSYINDICHILIYKERIPFSEIKSNKEVRKYIENCHQHFVHSVNHLSRNGVESPFSNISIFDRHKLKALIGPDNYGWYFPNKKEVLQDNNIDKKLTDDEYMSFVIEYMMEIQKIILKFHDKGDTLNNGLPYRFPVCFPGEENLILNDKIERFDIFSKYDYGWTNVENENLYTFYDGKNVKINNVFRGTSKEFITIIGKNGRTVTVTPDHKFKMLSGIMKEARKLKENDVILLDVTLDDKYIEDHDKISSEDYENGFVISSFVSTTYHDEKDVFNIEVDNKEHLYTLPNSIVTSNCTINISKTDDGKVEDEEFLKYICNLDIKRFNIFTSKGNKVCSCCRLLSDMELLDLGNSVNSFGGTSISMGSHRVCTINFARIALESTSMKEFYKILDKRILGASKVLKAHKVLIGKLERMGLQPFITNGWIRMDRLFSTYGVMGCVEAEKILKSKFGDELGDKDVMGEMLIYLNDKSQKYSKEQGIFSNIEQIPGESYSVRLATTDKLLFPDTPITTPMYANQFVPLWDDATLWEKLDADGRYNQLLTGGGIVHAQLGSETTPKQNEKIIRYAIESGCEHFALNAVYSKCMECNNVYNHKVTLCDSCSSTDFDYFTRTVGFLTNVKSWGKVKREFDFPNRTWIDDSLLN